MTEASPGRLACQGSDSPKPSTSLDKIVVDDTQSTKVVALWVLVRCVCKTEMKPAFKPTGWFADGELRCMEIEG